MNVYIKSSADPCVAFDSVATVFVVSVYGDFAHKSGHIMFLDNIIIFNTQKAGKY